ITVSADGNCQGVVPDVLASVNTTDNCTAAVQPFKQQNPAAGTVLAKGNYTITVSVQDAAGNIATQTIAFTIADTTAPVIQSLTRSEERRAGKECKGVVPDVLGSVNASERCTMAGQLVKTQ